MVLAKNCFDLPAETAFWLGILRDHSEFMFLALPSSETQAAKEAKRYMVIFHDLLKKVNHKLPDKLLHEIREAAGDFRKYQQDVLMKELKCSIVINLPPLILEHTIAEAGEFIDILDQVLPEKSPTLQYLHEHLLWLWDFSGHADLIIGGLDPTEALDINCARAYKESFIALFYKAYSLKRMLRPHPALLEVLKYLNEQSGKTSCEFAGYMEELKEKADKCKLLGTLPPLLLSHMIRETRYYISKIESGPPVKN